MDSMYRITSFNKPQRKVLLPKSAMIDEPINYTGFTWQDRPISRKGLSMTSSKSMDKSTERVLMNTGEYKTPVRATKSCDVHKGRRSTPIPKCNTWIHNQQTNQPEFISLAKSVLPLPPRTISRPRSVPNIPQVEYTTLANLKRPPEYEKMAKQLRNVISPQTEYLVRTFLSKPCHSRYSAGNVLVEHQKSNVGKNADYCDYFNGETYSLGTLFNLPSRRGPNIKASLSRFNNAKQARHRPASARCTDLSVSGTHSYWMKIV